MTERSNLAVFPNVMLAQSTAFEEIRFLPGDLAVQVYKASLMGRPDSIRRYLSPGQVVEYEQYLVCSLCRRPCAGTCRL